jgi:hypothetical protein
MVRKSSTVTGKTTRRSKVKAGPSAEREASAGDAGIISKPAKAVRTQNIAQRARRHTEAALEAFVSVMQDASAPAAARVAAATQILNWAHGKGSGGESDDAPKTVRLAWEA